MTLMSRALDKSVFDANSFLFKISEEDGRHRYVYIGGDMICSFLTNDIIHRYIPNVGIILTPYKSAIGEENNCFLTPHFKLIKRENINDIDLLKINKSSVDPYKYHVSNCGKYSFKKIRIYKIHSNYEN